GDAALRPAPLRPRRRDEHHRGLREEDARVGVAVDAGDVGDAGVLVRRCAHIAACEGVAAAVVRAVLGAPPRTRASGSAAGAYSGDLARRPVQDGPIAELLLDVADEGARPRRVLAFFEVEARP